MSDHPDAPIDSEKFMQMYDAAFPQGDHNRLLNILYEHSRLEPPQNVALLFYSHTLLYSNMTSKMYLNQVNCLVKFLESGGDRQTVTDFLTLAEEKLRDDDWPLSNSAEQVNNFSAPSIVGNHTLTTY
jgi:hypothetical protein